MRLKLILAYGSIVAIYGADARTRCKTRSHTHSSTLSLETSLSTSVSAPESILSPSSSESTPPTSTPSSTPTSTPSSSLDDITSTPVIVTSSSSSDTSTTPALSSTPSSDSGVSPLSTTLESTSLLATSTTSTTAVSSTSSTSSAPASTSTTPAEVYTGGFATFYFQNGSPPACGGRPRSDSELIVALDMRRYGSDYSAPSPYCSKMIRVTNANNGRSVDVTVVDVCPTCLNSNSLDLSPTAFQDIGDLNDGMVPIVWQFV
ncbi:unnamed protein product [Clonostachys chloroleuca]|uniref:RlpA-like protein double-psi beta-barrel domain-containing protein n=1 Tax=Clonostachys chloroleuca TaxID=1926264 RepID=A0AA35MFE9_9HYPO|nr:unnamed protein product [Clonostachys chloroleuca]